MMPLVQRLPLSPATRQWPVWGTTARLVVTDPVQADAVQALVSAQLNEIDHACSRFRDDSELALVQGRLDARPGRPVGISSLLADLIGAALDAAEMTDGDVDPTLADDLAALGYDRDYALITVETSAGTIPIQLSRRVRHNWRDVQLHRRQLSMPAGVRLDLGASAKAFAADRAAAAVAETYGCGVLVALGGDIATAGEANSATGWQILVQDGVNEPASRIQLGSGALATSSTVSRRWRNGTRAVHHILNPASGLPADPVFRTVSVAARTCAEANALTTAAIVRSWLAVPWLRSTGLPARLVTAEGDVITLGGWPAESRAGAEGPVSVAEMRMSA
jgi:thiamine biosynthesis lipoprotein